MSKIAQRVGQLEQRWRKPKAARPGFLVVWPDDGPGEIEDKVSQWRKDHPEAGEPDLFRVVYDAPAGASPEVAG